jgi:cell division protein FtsL
MKARISDYDVLVFLMWFSFVFILLMFVMYFERLELAFLVFIVLSPLVVLVSFIYYDIKVTDRRIMRLREKIDKKEMELMEWLLDRIRG